MFVTIVRRPLGEAPEWVRDAWIGVRLPLSSRRKGSWRGFGVLSGPKGFFPQLWGVLTGQAFAVTGYLVNAKGAVDLLAEKNPAAAEWWHQNVEKLLNGRSKFVFDEEACRLEAE
jgi:hypothetical protein